MTPLARHLIEQIRIDGPITLADYMRLCLLHPEHGYYATRDPLGHAGDFITAPEISQMFGELIGLSLAQSWLDQGAPAPFALVELGPGRGTLMADILRATKAVPGFHDAAQIHLVEASPVLRNLQQDTLRGWPVTWHDTADDLPSRPCFAVANEFFDALPIRQVVRQGNGWSERRVGVRDDALVIGQGPEQNIPALAHRLDDTQNGDVVEFCPEAAQIAGQIGRRIEAHEGAALFIDYGDWRALGDTFQAVRGHEHVDPMSDPGSADLTAHVDFEVLAGATPSAHSRLSTQGVFLERLGITARAQALAKQMRGEALTAHVAAHRRLTHPDEMGTLFKVLGFYPEGTPPPPGLEP